jgi:hypothetical protein
MNVEKQPESAMIPPDLINEVAYSIVILFVELSSFPILECTLCAAVGVNEGAVEVSDDNARRFSEDIKQELGDSPGDRASETIGVWFKPAVGGRCTPVRGLETPGGCLSPP